MTRGGDIAVAAAPAVFHGSAGLRVAVKHFGAPRRKTWVPIRERHCRVPRRLADQTLIDRQCEPSWSRSYVRPGIMDHLLAPPRR